MRKNSKLEVNGLDLLHEKTMLSISNSAAQLHEPAPGCIDKKLNTADNTLNGIPSVIIKDSSLLTVNDDLDNLLENFKYQFLHFVSYMQTPQYKISLANQIEEEKVC